MTIAELAEGPHAASLHLKVIDVYARVSRASDKTSKSTSDQVAINKKLVLAAGYLVGQVHIDVGKSAWNPKRRRPGWDTVMARLESGACDGIIVWELSRFARRAEDGLRLLRLAQDKKTPRIVIDSEGEYDLTKPKQAKTFMDAINQAEFESGMIGERTKRGKAMKAEGLEGETPASNFSTRAFGFEPGNIVPREAEAKELRAAAKMLLAGVKAQHICDDLNKRGIKTAAAGVEKEMPNGEVLVLTGEWRPTALRVALTRPANVGDIVHRGVVTHRGINPGLMDRKLYDEVVRFYGKRKTGRPVTNLATGFVQCADCRRPLHAKEMTSRNRYTPYPDGAPMKVYICVKRYGVGCGLMIDWRDLDAYVQETALTILSDPVHSAQVAAKAVAVDQELEQVLASLAEVKETIAYFDERLRLGKCTPTEHRVNTTDPDERRSTLEARRDQLLANAPQRAAVKQRASRATWDKRWAAGDITRRRQILADAFEGRRLLVSAGPRLVPARERCVFDVPLDDVLSDAV